MAKDLIPLISPNTGNYNVAVDKDVIAMYHNVAPIKTQAQEYSLSVRPSFGAAITTMSIDSDSRGRGIADFLGYDLIMVNDDTLYYSGGSTEIYSAKAFDKELLANFTYYSQAGSPRLVLNNAGATSTAGTYDGSLWYMTSPTVAPTRITDVDAPGNNGQSLIRGGVSLDGYFFAADIDGNIHNCDLDDITAWNALNYVVAEREPDVGVYLGKHKDHVVYYGTRAMEFFYNAANVSGSPLSRRNDIFHNIGCYHPNAILELGDITYFIGKDNSGNAGLYVLDGFRPTPVPLSPIVSDAIKGLEYADPAISDATNLQQDVYLASFNSAKNGQFLVLTLPNDGTFAFHMETGIWAKWYIGGTPTNNGGIADWEDPKIMPITSSLNRTGANTNKPNRYVLLNGLVSSEYVVPTGTSYSNIGSYDFSAQAADLFDVHIGDSGTKAYAVDPSTTTVYQYTLTTPYTLSSAVYASKSTSVVASGRCISFNADGTKFYITKGGTITVSEYTLSTAWDISTASFVDSTTLSGSNSTGSTWGDDGNSFYDVVGNSSIVVQFGATTPYDASTLTITGSKGIAGTLVGVSFNSTGSLMYIGDDTADVIKEYSLSTPWLVSTATATGTTISILSGTTRVCKFINDSFYIAHSTDTTGYQYGDAEFNPSEFGGSLTGVGNPDYFVISKPWDKDTNERKRVKNTRVVHYPDTRSAAEASNLGIGWVDTDVLTSGGITVDSFTNTRNVDVSKSTARLYRCGKTRQRIFKVVFNGTKYQIIKGLELDYDLLRG